MIVTTVSLLRWTCREWIRNGPCLCLAILALAVGPTTLVVFPSGVVSFGSLSGSYLDSIWYLSCLVGVLSAQSLSLQALPFWDEMGDWAAATGQIGLLLLGAAAHSMLAWATTAAMGELEPGVGSPLAGVLLCALHWSLIGAFSTRLLRRAGPALVATLLLGWWVPALAPADGRWCWLFDPGRHLALGRAAGPASWASAVDSIPLLAWWVATALLPKRSVFRR